MIARTLADILDWLWWRLQLIDRIEATETNRRRVKDLEHCARAKLPVPFHGVMYNITRIDVSKDGRFLLIYGVPVK